MVWELNTNSKLACKKRSHEISRIPATHFTRQNGNAFVVNRSSDALKIVVGNDLKALSLPGAEVEEFAQVPSAFIGQIHPDNILRAMGID